MIRELTRDEKIEKLAELEHYQWAHWTSYFLKTLKEIGVGIPEDNPHIIRWKNQIKTPYKNLSNTEKDSDRKWAVKAYNIAHEINRYTPEGKLIRTVTIHGLNEILDHDNVVADEYNEITGEYDYHTPDGYYTATPNGLNHYDIYKTCDIH